MMHCKLYFPGTHVSHEPAEPLQNSEDYVVCSCSDDIGTSMLAGQWLSTSEVDYQRMVPKLYLTVPCMCSTLCRNIRLSFKIFIWTFPIRVLLRSTLARRMSVEEKKEEKISTLLTVTRFELARETHHGFSTWPKRDAVTTWLHCHMKTTLMNFVHSKWSRLLHAASW